MTRAPARIIRPAVLLAGILWFAACAEHDATAPDEVRPLAAASAGSGPSVSATNPGFGHRGDAGLAVTIAGSGFKPGAQASWKIDGASTPDVVVLSTQYVSSSQLIATIDISGTATLTYYDVTVTQAGRKGIGTESVTVPDLFEVTTAIAVPALTVARRANDAGELSGTLASGGTAYFNTTTGFAQQVNATGTGYGISDRGDAIVGSGGAGNRAALWTRSGPVGSGWQETLLPVDPAFTSAVAKALVTDPVTGQVTLVGGYEIDGTGRNSSVQRPILWVWQSATAAWQRVVLATGSPSAAGEVVDLSAGGVAVGVANGAAAVWTPDGAGGYTLATIGPSGSRATGIDGASTVIAGRTGTGNSLAAVYWQRSGGAWGGPVTLPGGCDAAKGVADTGRIVLNSCPFGNRRFPAYIDPPYAAPVQLHGLGPQNTLGQISGISPSGQFVSGMVTSSTDQGIYWKLF